MTWRLEGTYFENCNCEAVCSTLAIGKATRSRVRAFGLEFENAGTNAHSGPFSWAG